VYSTVKEMMKKQPLKGVEKILKLNTWEQSKYSKFGSMTVYLLY